MPAEITINTGDPITQVFTYAQSSNGTAPFSYEIVLNGINGTGIVANIGGAENNEVTFDATNALAGQHQVILEGTVIDANGDRDTDQDIFKITVLPVLGSWDIGTLTIPSLDPGSTSSETATLSQSAGGKAPYTFQFEWVGGTAPAPGLSINAAGGVVSIDAAPDTPGGDYFGQIRGFVLDDNGQSSNGYLLNVSVMVAGLDGFAYDTDPAAFEGTIESATITSDPITVVGGSGGATPYSYAHEFFSAPPPGVTLIPSGASVQIRLTNPAALGTVSGTIRCRVSDSGGSQFITPTITYRITVTGGSLIDAFIQALAPAVDWRFDESAAPILNYGSAGADYNLANELNTPVYQIEGATPSDLAVTLVGDPSPAEGYWLDPSLDFSGFDISVGAVIAIVRMQGGSEQGNITERSTVFSFNDQANRGLSRVYLRNEAPASPDFTWIQANSGGSTINQLTSDLEQFNTSSWTVVVIVQRGDGTGPKMWINGIQDESIATINNANYWLDDIYTEWDVGTVGYYANNGDDGSTGGGTGNFGANIDVDRITFTTIAPSDAQIEELYDLIFGTPPYMLLTGGAAAGQPSGPNQFIVDERKENFIQASKDQSGFTQQGYVDIEADSTGRFIALSVGSSSDHVEMGEWSPTLRRYSRKANVNWSGSFKNGASFGRDPGGLLVCAAGESAPRAELAQYNGANFVLVSNPFDVLPPTNAFCCLFYATSAGEVSGIDDRLLVGGAVSGGIALRCYDRQAANNWDQNLARIDTQPIAGTSGRLIGKCLRKGGSTIAAFSYQTTGAVGEIFIYDAKTDGDLELQATRELLTSGSSLTIGTQSVDVTPDGRFVYAGSRRLNTGAGVVKVWDRDKGSGWEEVTPSGYDNNQDFKSLAVSPDGKFLAVAMTATTPRDNGKTQIYEIQADGSLVKDRAFSKFGTDNPAGENSIRFTPTYYSG